MERVGERLILPRKVIAYIDNKPTQKNNSLMIAGYEPGNTFVVWAAAPGTGRMVYEITKIDSQGIWGIIIEDTIGELNP